MCSVGLNAQNMEVLIVSTTDGDVDKILLSHHPSLHHVKRQDGSWTVTIVENITDTYTAEYGYPIEIIRDYTFSDGTDGIDQTINGSSRFTFSHRDGRVFIDGVNGNENVKVYTLDGREYKIKVSYIDGRAEIPFFSAPKGVYIVDVAKKQKFKIYIK